jgi:C-terminal processing protease CtpA/Prc
VPGARQSLIRRTAVKVNTGATEWTPGTTLTIRWYVGGKAIKGKTGKKLALKIKRKWAGKRLTVRVTGTQPGYTTRTLTSKKVKIKRP